MMLHFSMTMLIAAIFAVGPITHASPPQITPGTRLVCPAELGSTCFVFGGSYRPDYERAKDTLMVQDTESHEWNFRSGCDHNILTYIQPGEMCYGRWVKSPSMPSNAAEKLNAEVRRTDVIKEQRGKEETLDAFIRCYEQSLQRRAEASRPPVEIDYDL